MHVFLCKKEIFGQDLLFLYPFVPFLIFIVAGSNHRLDELHTSDAVFNSWKIKHFLSWRFVACFCSDGECEVAVDICKRFDESFRVSSWNTCVPLREIGQ